MREVLMCSVRRILECAEPVFLAVMVWTLHVGHGEGPVRQDIPRVVVWLNTRYEHITMRILHRLVMAEWIYRNRFACRFVERISEKVIGTSSGEVITFEEFRHLLRKLFDEGYTVATGTCPCRRALREFSDELPNDTDMVFGPWAEKYLKAYPDLYRRIDHEEAVRLAEDFERHGLVHQVYGWKNLEGSGTVVCNCHPDVCVPLLAYMKRGYESFRKGRSRAVVDASACLGGEQCGVCLDRCAFGARRINAGKAEVDADACFGCGLCVSTCRGDATTLQRVPGAGLVYSRFLVD